MRWGILSTANIARRLVEGARVAEGIELVAVGSRDPVRGRAFADELGIPRAHGSYEALLADPDVDAIYNPLPNSLHVPWSIKALEAGKHVLCEKPLSRHPDQVDAAFDAADRAGRLLMEAFMWRFHPQTEAVSGLVAEGAVGNLRYVRAAFGFNLPEGDNVRWSGELEGGALMDVGCYCVSALRLLCGEPQRVSGELVRGGGGVDGRFAGVLRFAGDVLGSFDCGMDVLGRSGLEVVGDSGRLLVEDPWKAQPEPGIVLERENGEREEIEVTAADPYARELEEFSAAARDGGQPRLGRADALGQARAIEALYTAAETGGAVTL
jgi:xylose dehydrogenase (NAD/NADP)